MIDRIRQLIRENNMCVLATAHHNRPHCSLMAYSTDEEGNTIYMVTRKATQKYKNLLENPQVSLLIDTRAATRAESRSAIQALTISGTCAAVEDRRETDFICRQIIGRHPHLKELVEHPDAIVVSVKFDSFLLLDGALEAHRVSAESG